MNKPILYFIDMGNSLLSQMAEGLARKYMSDEYYIFSAGIEKHCIDPRAVKVMEDINIDITDQKSEFLDLELLGKAEFVITLSKPSEVVCPQPKEVNHLYWRFYEPFNLDGSKEEKWEVIKDTRDELETFIQTFKEKHLSSSKTSFHQSD